MSEQDGIAFEKWAKENGFDITENKHIPTDYEDYDTHCALMGWNAATAEANKRMVELEREVARKDSLLRTLENVADELQANNHDLREALQWIDDSSTDGMAVTKAHKALSTTPAESLAKHDDEVIEKCAKVCDGYYVGYDSQMEGAGYDDFIRLEFARDAALVMREAIRALKGK